MQMHIHHEDGRDIPCSIPDADTDLMPGIPWGEAGCAHTPAYWRFSCVSSGALDTAPSYRLGESLAEEVTACLLGGHGISGELGNAAFAHLRQHGVFQGPPPPAPRIEALLRDPLDLAGRTVHYRFPAKKAHYIAGALHHLASCPPEDPSPRALRDALLTVPGVGLKTASWAVRNWTDSDEVAILDIHIHRAGVLAGLYGPDDDIRRAYHAMEARFVQFARAIDVPANVLDNEIWCRLRQTPALVRRQLVERGVRAEHRCGLPRPRRRVS